MTLRKFTGFTFFIAFLSLMPGLYSCKHTSDKKEGVEEKKVYVSDANSMIQTVENGKIIYIKNCKVCHQLDGKGVSKMYPPIVGTKQVKGNPKFLIDVLLNGLTGEIKVEGEKYNNVMASYRHFTDQEIADVLNYIRHKSDENLKLITSDDVKDRR